MILDLLLKWFAPILAFTTEEIFQIINNQKSSIHLESFSKIPSTWKDDKLFQKWEKLKVVRSVTNAAIEVKRSNKDIGSRLEADVKIYLGEEYLEIIKDINLPEYFITSKAEVKKMIKDQTLFTIDGTPNISIDVKKAEGNKCSRCWKILKSPCERNNCGLKN